MIGHGQVAWLCGLCRLLDSTTVLARPCAELIGRSEGSVRDMQRSFKKREVARYAFITIAFVLI